MTKPELWYTIPGISAYLRKIALRLKMRKVIEQQGDQYIIKTTSAFRNYTISFKVDQEFEEFTQGLDKRHVKVKKYGKIVRQTDELIPNRKFIV